MSSYLRTLYPKMRGLYASVRARARAGSDESGAGGGASSGAQGGAGWASDWFIIMAGAVGGSACKWVFDGAKELYETSLAEKLRSQLAKPTVHRGLMVPDGRGGYFFQGGEVEVTMEEYKLTVEG